MGEAEIKALFKVLAQAVFDRISDARGGYAKLRIRGRTAGYDTSVDGSIARLTEFVQAERSLHNLNIFQERFGEGDSGRVTLQFVYELFDRSDRLLFDINTFEEYWSSFWAEIGNPDWIYYSVTNLQDFAANFPSVDMGHGVSIRERDFDELRELLGWGDYELEAMKRDWREAGVSSAYILLAEQRVPKSPENLVMSNTLEVTVKANRMLLAMRLFKQGDIRIGRMWDSRPAAFNLMGGMSSSGGSGWNPGKRYQLEIAEVNSVFELYQLIERFQSRSEENLSNIGLALRTFTSTYERSLYQGADRVVDDVTALEALLPTHMELAFKLAYRVAGILAENDDNRVALFKRIKAFYRTRSNIVHGSSLKGKDRELIRDDQELRTIVRRLLVGFLHLAESTQFRLGRSFYENRLDGDLLHEQRRSVLRKEMKLVC